MCEGLAARAQCWPGEGRREDGREPFSLAFFPRAIRKVMRGPGGVTVTHCRASGSLGVPGPPGECCGHVHRTERGSPTREAERLGVRPHRPALAAGPHWGPRDSGLVVVAASTACCI